MAENEANTDARKIPDMTWHPEWMCDDSAGDSQPRPCVIHRPSRHHMRGWPVRMGKHTVVERQCGHGKWHPDMDAANHFFATGEAHILVHQCDKCCLKPPKALGYGSDIPVTREEDELFDGSALAYMPWEDATWD